MSARIIAICGKICSGKTYYAQQLRAKECAVILSCDELTHELFDNDLGERHDELARRIWRYFFRKAAEIVGAGCSVILDWGFWRAADRQRLTVFCHEQSIALEWHYIDVDDATWQRNIAERNARVLAGAGGDSYFLDEGLLEKLLSRWETPKREEIDFWHVPKREDA